MRETTIEFFSDGLKLSALLRLPDDASGLNPGIVQGPGWMGLKDARLYVRYHEALTAAGFAVLIFDYRGFGDSEGSRQAVRISTQVEDLMSAVSYLRSRDDIDPDRIGVFGSGGTGGGNAVLLAGCDPRVRCVVAQVPIADGLDWLRRMRSEGEWKEFLKRLDGDRGQRAAIGSGELVDPKADITIPTAERRATTIKKDVDGRVPTEVSLIMADDLMVYRPLNVVHRISPTALMIIAVEADDVTPTDHSVKLYEQAGPPKTLILQRHVTHYGAYDRNATVVVPRIVDWFTTHLAVADVLVRSSDLDDELFEVLQVQENHG